LSALRRTNSIASSRGPLREIALVTVCAGVLFSVCILVFLIAIQRAEREAFRASDRMVRHEPLDSRNQ
jgi:hypothetical protein